MNSKFNLPLYSPGKQSVSNRNCGLVAADLRLENSLFAYYTCKNGTIESSVEKLYPNKDFSSVSEIIKKFITEEAKEIPSKISLAVPGPVVSGYCETVNLPWILEEEKLKKELSLESIYLVNDLEATSYSLTEFDKDKLEFLHHVENLVHGNVAVLAPGNGLGEAGLFWDGEALRPFASEGGHTEFSPRTDFEVEFYLFLKKIYGIVSWENVLSKEGLYNIYRFMRDVGRHQEDPEMKERMKHQDFLEVITDFANRKSSRLIKITLEMYAEFLAREANNLALKFKATGGLVITGEIPSKLFHLINKEKFYKDFKISDRMENLLKDIPIYLIRNPKGIIDGAAFYGAYLEN